MSQTLDGEAPFLDSVLARMNGFLYRCHADTDFTMMALTSGFERCSGISADDILGNKVRSFASLIHPDDLAAVDEAVVKGLEAQRNWNINYRLLNAAGGYIWVHEDGGGVWHPEKGLVFLEGAVFDIQHLYASLVTQFQKPAA
ncbi:MAG: PAS domain-containing protein [Hyphomicrobium sp.]|nr:PAS domain-containing protein [Hyphomicrobium sp.]